MGPEYCRSCGSQKLTLFGRGARGRYFAGSVIDPPLDGGWFYRCKECDLLQRHPILTPSELVALYSRSSSVVWSTKELRSDQHLVAKEIERLLASGGRVLDIGCAAGELLSALPDTIEKYGIEPSHAARAVAEAKGIHILGTDLNELEQHRREFDVICAIDVIEHIANPLEFLKDVSRLLSKSGVVLISTGNSRALPWLIAGPTYYYSHNFEHISCISEKWCTSVHQHGFESRIVESSFAHVSPGNKRSPIQDFVRFSLRLSASLFERVIWSQLPTTTRTLGPRVMVGEAGAFNDHMLVSFKPVDPRDRSPFQEPSDRTKPPCLG